MRQHSPASRRRATPAPPLDAAALGRLALGYLGRYATTRAKLLAYLQRKLAERGWAGDAPPEPQAVVERMAALGYVDDRAYADARRRAFQARGLGRRRLAGALRAAGIAEDDAASALAPEEEGDDERAVALAFARRRRLGPFAKAPADPAGQRRALAAMLRAGHDFAVARAVLAIDPDALEGADADFEP